MVAGEKCWPDEYKGTGMPRTINSGAGGTLGRVGLEWCNSADRCIALIADAKERGKSGNFGEYGASEHNLGQLHRGV